MTSRRHNGDPGPAANPPDRMAMDLLPAALRTVGERVRAVTPAAWSARTPCEGWTVRDLVNHLAAEHLWAPQLLAGRTIEDVGTRFDGDVLGEDPRAAWDGAAEASLRAWRACSPGTTVHLSFGDTPATEYAEQMLLDLLVHGWDLGAALRAGAPSADETRSKWTAMDPAQVVHVLEWVRGHHDELTGSGLFGAPAPDDGGAGPATLLRLLGRDPHWRPTAVDPLGMPGPVPGRSVEHMSEDDTRMDGARPDDRPDDPRTDASKPVEQWVTGDEPMTGPQRSYLETLAREAGEQLPAELTKAEASELIDRLQHATGRGV